MYGLVPFDVGSWSSTVEEHMCTDMLILGLRLTDTTQKGRFWAQDKISRVLGALNHSKLVYNLGFRSDKDIIYYIIIINNLVSIFLSFHSTVKVRMSPMTHLIALTFGANIFTLVQLQQASLLPHNTYRHHPNPVQSAETSLQSREMLDEEWRLDCCFSVELSNGTPWAHMRVPELKHCNLMIKT